MYIMKPTVYICILKNTIHAVNVYICNCENLKLIHLVVSTFSVVVNACSGIIVTEILYLV